MHRIVPKEKISGDTLLIHYDDLGIRPDHRLRALRALASMMRKAPGLYTAAALSVTNDEWMALRSWLLNADLAGEALAFWRAEPRGVRVLRICASHVLIGTQQMLDDLLVSSEISVAAAQQSSSRRSRAIPSTPPAIEELWLAAKQYVVQEVNQSKS